MSASSGKFSQENIDYLLLIPDQNFDLKDSVGAEKTFMPMIKRGNARHTYKPDGKIRLLKRMKTRSEMLDS